MHFLLEQEVRKSLFRKDNIINKEQTLRRYTIFIFKTLFTYHVYSYVYCLLKIYTVSKSYIRDYNIIN